ncbi:MAG: hypothetical protein H8E18_09680 [FCB group bacterium]|nr:hypothetical protein [FCB group bacterium]
MLQITAVVKNEIEVDKLRILDFYLAFPAELLSIKSFRGFNKYRELIEAESNKYERVLDRKRLFYKMEHIQISAIKTLVSYGVFDPIDYKRNIIKRTEIQLSEDINERIEQANAIKEDIIKLITGPLASMNLYGHLGLKVRANLLEFRYDAV